MNSYGMGCRRRTASHVRGVDCAAAWIPPARKAGDRWRVTACRGGSPSAWALWRRSSSAHSCFWVSTSCGPSIAGSRAWATSRCSRRACVTALGRVVRVHGDRVRVLLHNGSACRATCAAGARFSIGSCAALSNSGRWCRKRHDGTQLDGLPSRARAVALWRHRPAVRPGRELLRVHAARAWSCSARGSTDSSFWR